MADDIMYHYPSMEHAAQEMSRINGQITSECNRLMERGKSVCAGATGTFIEEYQRRVGNLTSKMTELTSEFQRRIRLYETEFEAMKGMDANLGATF